MEFKYRILGSVFLCLLLQACCWFKECDECFEDANLWFPDQVTSIEIERTYVPTTINGQYHQFGTSIGVYNGVYAFNEFFAVTRFDSQINQNVKHFWNRDTPPSFANLEEGEIITFYKAVFNQNLENSIECSFQEVQEVSSILEVKVRTDAGDIVGTRTVEQTIFSIPSGKYGVFKFEFEFLSCGNYEFDIEIDPSGQLSETSINDNNYSEEQTNFGFCF